MDLKIRKARPGEMWAIIALYEHYRRGDVRPKNPGRVWKETLGDRKLALLVATLKGGIVGSCLLIVVPNLNHYGRPFGVIENVITHEDFRRRGIGTRLMRRALAMARKKGCYKVMLLTGAKRRSVHRFYQKAGFKKGIKAGYVALFKGKSELE